MIQAKVFSSSSGDCAAFLSNYHSNNTARVTFNGRHYTLPPWSISILPDCKSVIYNTAQVSKIESWFEARESKLFHCRIL